MKIQVKFLSIVLAAAVCVSLTACNGTPRGTNSSISSEGGTNSSNSSSDITNGLFDNTPDAEPPEDAVYYDYSMYEGLWLSDEENLYPDTYILFTEQGS